jgi:hypothetical protein
MNETQTIQVMSNHDIIWARMRVREFAREQGFSMVDQARISLATSSLANAMELSHANQGQIVIDCVSDERGTGVRIICKKTYLTGGDPQPLKIGDTRWMVDELNVERLPPNEVRVTVIKWDGRKKVNGVPNGNGAGSRR